MSKVDALRALREARYAADRASVATTPAKKPAPSRPTGTSAALRATPVDAAEPTGEPALCGHRNMGGKSCSRPENHPEKNHRYG